MRSCRRYTPTLIPMSVNVTNGPVPGERARGAARCPFRRRGLPSGRRVIRAADADRPVRHAVRADAAAALRARDVRLPVGMSVAAKGFRHGRLAYPRARRRRVHSGRGRSGPDRDRHRRHPRDVDDLPGARRGLRTSVLRGRGRGGSCAPRGARRGRARRRAERRPDPRLRSRKLAARVRRARRLDAHPLDDERHARGRRRSPALRARATSRRS